MNVECCAGHKNLNENIGARNHMTPHMTYQPHYTSDNIATLIIGNNTNNILLTTLWAAAALPQPSVGIPAGSCALSATPKRRSSFGSFVTGIPSKQFLELVSPAYT